jgi:hypothetical protein
LDGVNLLELEAKTFPKAYLLGRFVVFRSDEKIQIGPCEISGGWSLETLQKFQELLQAMEKDLLSKLFDAPFSSSEPPPL